MSVEQELGMVAEQRAEYKIKYVMDNQQLYNIKNDFLKEWPIEKLETMTLEEYSNLDKTSFCYSIEHTTRPIGSIRGGSSYKFGIYRMSASSETEPANNRTNNGKYAWHTKYGSTQEEAFQSIKNTIIQVIRLSQDNNLNPIDNIDLGDAYKWKIAFLYGNYNIINVFNKSSLNRIALGLGIDIKEAITISDLNHLILLQKPDSEDFFEFSNRIWNDYGSENDTSKFKDLIHDFDAYINDGNTILNQFEINPKYFGKNYVGYWDSDKNIGDKIAHYEIIVRKNKLYVEVHFEGSQLNKGINRTSQDIFSKTINILPEKAIWFDWNKSKSIRYDEIFNFEDTDIIPKLAHALLYLEVNLGDQLRAIKNSIQTKSLKLLIANITWNSKDWKDVSEDASGHEWVGGENIPHESWNFDFDNPRNCNGKILGFAKFTNAPSTIGDDNLIIFYSKGKIVGFYAKAEILKKEVPINDKESYNLIGDKSLSVVLNTKIDNIKEKGYLETKERVGQVGFSYLEKVETALHILDEAILLNSEQEEVLNEIKHWVENNQDSNDDEQRLIKILHEIGFEDSVKFYYLMEKLLLELKVTSGDKRLCYSLPKNKLIGLTIGQKYCAVIEIKKGLKSFRYIDTSKNEKNWLKEASSILKMCEEFDTIYKSATKELNKTNKTGFDQYSSSALENSLFKKEYKTYIFQKAFNHYINTENMNIDLNQILFGPPGTGKTFNSINEALKIVDPIYFEAHENDRTKLTDRFKELLIKNWDETKGQIAFCTFHQSFSYEDFVEGIKPKTSESKNVYYDIEAGVFKRICQLADSNNSTVKVIKEGKFTWDEGQFNSASFFKLSLGQANSVNDRPIYEYCRDNNYIAIGFGEENDFSSMSENQIVEKCKELGLEATSGQQLNYFIHNLKINNYVIIGNGNKNVRAIGKVIGDYEYVADSPIQYNHFRKVEWLFVDANIPIEELYEKGLSQKTLYKIDETALKKDFFTNKGQQEVIDVKEDKKYVLIIDEINRGNVSSIFGELITLIEKDKRAGCNEELEVTLPYSKESFKVPKNVYLIGTMNTADRSIEALDTALRRRFSFKEFAPKPELIKTEGLSGALKGIVNGIDLALLLNTINTRIEKLIDKDHKIGHSYLLKVNSEETLKSSFRNEIIPLLEEYFFGDYGKIGLVLGSTFVEKINHDFNFAIFDDYDTDIQSDLKEKKVFRIAAETNWDFSKI